VNLPAAVAERFVGARRALCLGIGGGGDVVGALAAAELLKSAGVQVVVGGLTWERRPIDPIPGPRRLDEITGAERVNDVVALAGPDTRGAGGFRFAESRIAGLLGEPTVLVDPSRGPAGVAAGLHHAAGKLGLEAAVFLDVGGDVLAHGHEPGLASPLADAVMLAAGIALQHAGLPVAAAVFGAGCDGELTPDEVAARLGEVRAAGGALGVAELSPEQLDAVRVAVDVVPTEASAMAVRAAAGETGRASIRDGRRTVRLTPAGGEIAFFDPRVAARSAARLATLVRGAASLEEADALLRRRGIRTELAFEERAQREPPVDAAG
jgi:hypothetical protein